MVRAATSKLEAINSSLAPGYRPEIGGEQEKQVQSPANFAW
jgi:hypothetical protein